MGTKEEQGAYDEADITAKILGARQARLTFATRDDGLPASRSGRRHWDPVAHVHYDVLANGELASFYRLAKLDNCSGES